MKFSILRGGKTYNYLPTLRHKEKTKTWISPLGYTPKGKIRIMLRESLWVPYSLTTNEKE